MSLTLPAGSIRSPWQNGMIEGMNQGDPQQYQYVAYRHPHGFTWFAGPRAADGEEPAYGGFIHWIRSTVQGKEIPPKDDREVAAVTYAGYAHLHQLETQWWLDYDAHWAAARNVWAAQNHPGVPVHFLPNPPYALEFAAIKHAHRQVAVREGRVGELPNYHDQWPNLEVDYYLFN